MTDLIERMRLAAKILREIGGQSAMAATVKEAADALEAARDDAERLDWMDANGFTAYRGIDAFDGMSDHATVVHETQRPRRGNVADTIRAAIDQARRKGGGR